MLYRPKARLSSGQGWFRCPLSHPSRAPVSSAVTWLPASLLILELKGKAWTQAFPPTPFPWPFPFPQLQGGGNLNTAFKALGWGLGNCLWSWVVGSWVFVQESTGGNFYEEFLLVGALTLLFSSQCRAPSAAWTLGRTS